MEAHRAVNESHLALAPAHAPAPASASHPHPQALGLLCLFLPLHHDFITIPMLLISIKFELLWVRLDKLRHSAEL